MSFNDQYRGNSTNRGEYSRNSPANYGNSNPNNYEQLVKIASENIRQLSSNVVQIKQLSETLGSARDSLENRENLRRIIDATRVLSSDTVQLMKDLNSFKSQDKMKKIQQQKLMTEFESSLKKFQDISKFALEKERSLSLPQPKSTKYSSSSGYDEDSTEDLEKQSLIESQRIQQIQFENERQFMDSLISDREQGIKDIEKSVVEVNEIFRDLSVLVSEQGVMIDNIESNIEESTIKTTEGVQELRKANEYQKSSRNKLCCLALIILIVAAILVIVLYLVLK